MSDPQDDTILDLDDVEGHGLREVAAGLSAAAVLAGGGTAALAATASVSRAAVHPSSATAATMRPGGEPIDVDRLNGSVSAVNHEVATVRAKVEASTRNLLPRTASTDSKQSTTGQLTELLAGVNHDVAKVELIADQVLIPTESSDASVRPPDVLGDVKKALHPEGPALTASTTAPQGLRTVERKVATVLSVVTTTTGNGVHTASATLTPVSTGPTTDAQQAGGWLLVKSGDTVLAQVHVKAGRAVVSWSQPLADRSVTISYTGDELFAPSLRTLSL